MNLWIKVSSLFIIYFFFKHVIRGTYLYLIYEAPSGGLLSTSAPDISGFLLKNVVSNWSYLILIGLPIIYFGWFNRSKQNKLYPKIALWSNLGIILVSIYYLLEIVVAFLFGSNIWKLFTAFLYFPPYLPLPLLIIVIYPLFYYTWKDSKKKEETKPDTGIKPATSALPMRRSIN